ncbi:MAG: pilus assembly protein PilM, partial [Polyangiaceae bacterium]|nr:pilus assembly protein PilM [Polyangiaceae bacterium]
MAVFVGIDIRNNEVIAAAVKTAYRKLALSGVGSALVLPDGDLDVAIKDAVSQALRRPGAGDGVAVSLAQSKVITRTLAVPTSAQKQLLEVIPFELEADLPFDLDGTVFDHKVGPTTKESTMLSIDVALAKTEDVQGVIDRVRKALGVEPERVGVGAYPSALVLPYVNDRPASIVGILDIGPDATELLLLRDETVLFSRSLPFGAASLPEAAPKLAREVRRTVLAFCSQGGEKPGLYYLVGPGAFISGAEAFLSNELETLTKVLPTLSMENDEAMTTRPSDAEAAKYIPALGLALSMIGKNPTYNLRQGALVFERGLDWIRERLPTLVGFGVAMGIAFLVSAGIQMAETSRDRLAYESALGKVTKEVLGREITSAPEATELLTKQVGNLDEDPLPHADAFDVMVELADAVPKSMKHDVESLDVQKGHVKLDGVAPTIPDVETIVTNLQSKRCFQDVKRGRTSQQPNSDRQKYTIEF